ncbi:MAG TPA: helix-turn-helix transcriptional regulator [Pseudonocardia sp.]|jgi:transcriptional regulator with XRE-family HTH domain
MGVKPRGRRKQFARRLKMLRIRSRLTLEEVAVPMRFSTSKLQRVEAGENLIDVHALKSLLDIYGVTADRWQEYFDLLDDAREPGWWRSYGLDDRGYVPLEADASLVSEFCLAHLPALLQTAEYTAANFRAGPNRLRGEPLHKAVTVRMIRQKRLTSAEDPLRLVTIIDESALYRVTGSPAVMAAQLARLIEAAALDTVTLHVLPAVAGTHLTQIGSFSLLSFDDLDEPDVAYVEHQLGSVHSERESIVTAARLRFDRLRSEALSPEESVAVLRSAAERYAGSARSEPSRGPQRRPVAQEQLQHRQR